MTTYHITARCLIPHYTTYEVDAVGIEDAIRKAKLQAPNEYPERCHGADPEWDEFEIEDENGDSTTHIEPSRRAANAGLELLAALEFFYNAMHDYKVSARKGHVRIAFRRAREALANAKGGAI